MSVVRLTGRAKGKRCENFWRACEPFPPGSMVLAKGACWARASPWSLDVRQYADCMI